METRLTDEKGNRKLIYAEKKLLFKKMNIKLTCSVQLSFNSTE